MPQASRLRNRMSRLSLDMTGLKRKGESDLWSKEIQTRVRIGLAGIRKVLIQYTDLPAEAVAKLIGNSHSAQNVEGEILSLPPELPRLAVDSPETNTPGEIWDKPATGGDKVVAQSQIHPEVMVLDAANDRLGQKAEVNLVVATKESFAVEVVSPAHPRGQDIGADLIILGRIKRAKEVCTFNGELETRRFVRNCDAGTCIAIRPAECERRTRKSRYHDYHCRPKFH